MSQRDTPEVGANDWPVDPLEGGQGGLTSSKRMKGAGSLDVRD